MVLTTSGEYNYMSMDTLKILSVEDDVSVQIMLEGFFEDEGTDFSSADTLKEAISLAKVQNPDVILLDLNVSGENSLVIINDLKAICDPIIIIVSGKTETSDRIIGLEMGADDYLTKPFHLKELSLKIQSLVSLRQVSGPVAKHKDVFCFREWIFKPAEFSLMSPTNENVVLTTSEFQLLEVFVNAPNRVLSREYLYEATRSTNFESFDRALDVQVGRLRKKLNDDPKQSKFIRTVRGVGYQFCAPLKP